MQIDSETTSVLSALVGIGSSIIGYAVSQGINKEKIANLEKQMELMREQQEKLVPYTYLNAVLEPLKDSLEDVQKDVKEILHVISGYLKAEK